MKGRAIFLLLLLAQQGCIAFERDIPDPALLSESREVSSEQRLVVDLGFAFGGLTVSPAQGNSLYRLDLSYDRRLLAPDIHYEILDGYGRLKLNMPELKKIPHELGRKRTIRLDFQVTTAVPVEMALKAGLSDAKIDLTGVKLEELELKAGLGEVVLAFYQPNQLECRDINIKAGLGEFKSIGLGNANFRHLEFSGGMGEASLDFTGQWQQDAEAEIKLGMGSVSIILPSELGVEIDAEERFLSSLHLDSFSKQGRSYLSDNYERSKRKLHIRLQAGIGSIKVRWT